MKKGGSASKKSESISQTASSRPWLLAVPDYGNSSRCRSYEKSRPIVLDFHNDANLLTESKADPQWHTMRIPLERRKVMRLPVPSWSVDDGGSASAPEPIKDLLEAEDSSCSRQSPKLASSPCIIPLKSRKRKRRTSVSSCDPDPPLPRLTTNDESRNLDRTSCSTASGLESRSTEPSRAPGAPQKPQAETREPILSALLANSVSTTAAPSEAAIKIEELSDGEASSVRPSPRPTVRPARQRSPSPPMLITSVRSLADNSSYKYDALEERIPVGSTGETKDDQPPLYIFNPARRCSELVLPKAQNGLSPTVDSIISGETPSDTRTAINVSSKPAKDTATPLPRGLRKELDCLAQEIQPVSDPPTGDFLEPKGPEKMSREVKREILSATTVPVMTTEEAFPIGTETSLGGGNPNSPTGARSDPVFDSGNCSGSQKESSRGMGPGKLPREVAGVAQVTSFPSGQLPNGDDAVRSEMAVIPPTSPRKSGAPSSDAGKKNSKSLDSDQLMEAEERSQDANTNEDPELILGLDPNTSPFDDSDGSDDDGDIREAPGSVEANFTSCVLRELDQNCGDATEGAQRITELDHCYSRPITETGPSIPEPSSPDTVPQPGPTEGDSVSIEAPLRLVVRLPKPSVHNGADGLPTSSLPSKRLRKNSSSSSTDTSVGVSTKAAQFDTSVIREQKQEELVTKRKVMKSEIILTKMQYLTQKEKTARTGDSVANAKLNFSKKLANYFHKNDFSKEPLNRSILNAMAEWLSPLPNGKIPPLSLRSVLIDLIRHVSATTPAQVFQSSSIEGVLILLMNHPKESVRNKRIEWHLVSSWRDD